MQLSYDFGYGQKIGFLAEYPMLLLSAQSAALIAADVMVPWVPAEASGTSGGASEVAPDALRQYIAATRMLACDVEPETTGARALEEQILAARKSGCAVRRGTTLSDPANIA